MNSFKSLAIAVLVLLISACATPLSQKDLDNIKTVGILNDFPDKPNFTNVGTTIFNNENDTVDDSSYKEFLTATIEDVLIKKGYKVTLLSDDKPHSHVDLVLKVIPRDVYNMPSTYGFGFYERSLLGGSLYRKSYVALNLSPMTNGESRCNACYAESLTDLPVEEIPSLWNDLSDEMKLEFEKILKNDIVKTIDKVFPKTRL